MERKKVVVLGSTGSIGQNTLSVARENPDSVQIVGLAAGKNLNLLIRQIREFRPGMVSMSDEDSASLLREMFPELVVFSGSEGATHLVEEAPARVVVAAISGMGGLAPIAAAIRRHMDVALANKEALVAAGRLLMNLASEHGVNILPVDSEHSAIWQALQGRRTSEVKRVILTASGGPFFGFDRDDLTKVTVDAALKHPTWSMGGKISIDSATLMNKGLEVIEAHHLFSIPYEKIEVLIHPESVIHSFVEFIDGSQLAQCSDPDMRIPIQYALSYPKRWPASWVTNSFAGSRFSFHTPDDVTFGCLSLAVAAGKAGDYHTVVLNAANEEAVKAFLAGQIGFVDIETTVRKILYAAVPEKLNDLDDVFAADEKARSAARDYIEAKGGA
ncbi:MAG TPA: 1-deoxy-D-xylulose-5-phosphate reductoisomerase [Bacillota bacterium]|nr:1-deoxy-D-xylulose-5-phosphate reductoisomerase [Bacillota bacterium]